MTLCQLTADVAENLCLTQHSLSACGSERCCFKMTQQLKLANFGGKKRVNSSNVWEHFGFKLKDNGTILDKTKAVCKYCEAEIKYTGGSTSNLASHYNNHHLILEKKSETSSGQASIDAAFSASKKYPKTSGRHLLLQRKVAEYLVADMKPLSTVESPAFRNLCTSLDPKFDVPSKKTISNSVIPKMYAETKAKVANFLQENTGLAITTDGWTSIATQSYITMTAHFINKDWQLTSYGLQTRHVTEPHSRKFERTIF